MRAIDSLRDGLDEVLWDRLVAQDPNGHLLQTWDWGELKGSFGWSPWRVAIERDGSLLAGAQVLYRRLGPLTMAYIPKGPVLCSEDGEVEQALWQAVHARSRRMRSVLLKVEPEWRDDEPGRHAWLVRHGFRPSGTTIQPRRTVIVDLADDEETMLARMKAKWRYNIRLSARKGVEIRTAGHEGLGVFYDLMRVTGERDAFGIHTRSYYERAYDLFSEHGRARLLIAYHEDEPLAALMPFAFNGQSWYMYGASSNTGRELMPNHQLQWRAMQWARAEGCTQYDLWGISDAEVDASAGDLQGVQRFKEGFGGEIVRYVGAYDHLYLAPVYSVMERVWARRRQAGQAPA
ncbi:MAG: peptidoglycan bridge formation glycyltransferase FemA/FemB family protein [Anaerolineae bacterium]